MGSYIPVPISAHPAETQYTGRARAGGLAYFRRNEAKIGASDVLLGVESFELNVRIPLLLLLYGSI